MEDYVGIELEWSRPNRYGMKNVSNEKNSRLKNSVTISQLRSFIDEGAVPLEWLQSRAFLRDQ